VKNLTWQNPEPLGFAASRVEELFVAQVLIKKVKLKCCGIKGYLKNDISTLGTYHHTDKLFPVHGKNILSAL